VTAQTRGFQQPIAQFSTGVQLVEVYATVTDADGGLVTGLKREDFEVREDQELQEVSAFAAGEFPLTVVLGIDRSWSMAGEPLRLAKAASQTFLRQLRPSDRSMAVAIGSDAEVIAPLSNDHAQQQRAIDLLDPWSTTSLHDAIISILDRLEKEPGRQALVVFSDGVDRYSNAPASRVIDRARQSQALIYPITLGKNRPPLAAELAVVSGGRSFQIRDARALDETFTTIARELRYQYLLGYAPMKPGASGEHTWRSIRVTVKGRSDMRVRARDGYTAG
jgi:Ca-activated chloride channel family protein